MSIRIIDLTASSALVASDQIPIYSSTQGDVRRVSGTALATFVQGNINVQDNKISQYSAPSASPFTTTVTASSSSIWLIITPTGTLANGTIVLPPSGTAVDRQEVLVNCTQAVTTLVVSATGLNVTGAPTTLAANAFFRMRYDAVSTTWYRVG